MHKRILIVEDEAPIRDMVAFALRKADMEVAQAADARRLKELESENAKLKRLVGEQMLVIDGLKLCFANTGTAPLPCCRHQS